LFSISNCALISIRNKEDIINQIIAGGVTGGLLAFRAGRRIAFKNAIFGSIFLAAIGVVEVGMIKYQRKQQLEMQN
jgi:import inner membrane translocase subunit TIM17